MSYLSFLYFWRGKAWAFERFLFVLRRSRVDAAFREQFGLFCEGQSSQTDDSHPSALDEGEEVGRLLRMKRNNEEKSSGKAETGLEALKREVEGLSAVSVSSIGGEGEGKDESATARKAPLIVAIGEGDGKEEVETEAVRRFQSRLLKWMVPLVSALLRKGRADSGERK